MIFTSKRQVKDPFAGQNTQHLPIDWLINFEGNMSLRSPTGCKVVEDVFQKSLTIHPSFLSKPVLNSVLSIS